MASLQSFGSFSTTLTTSQLNNQNTAKKMRSLTFILAFADRLHVVQDFNEKMDVAKWIPTYKVSLKVNFVFKKIQKSLLWHMETSGIYQSAFSHHLVFRLISTRIYIFVILYYWAYGKLKSSDVSNHSAQDVLNTLKEGLTEKDIVRDLVSSCETRSLEFIHSCRKTHHEVECSSNWFHGSPSDFRRVGNVTNNAEVYLYGTSYITPEFTLCITQFQYSPFFEEFLSFEECFVCGFEVNPLLNCPMLTIREYEYEIVQRDSQQTMMWYAGQVFLEGTFLQLGDGRGGGGNDCLNLNFWQNFP